MSIDAHPELPEFDYIRPSTLIEASQFLATHAGKARPLCGGTDIFVRMRDGFWHDQYLVDIKNLDGTNQIQFDPQTGLTIGAGVNMNRVMAHPQVQEHYALLVEACRSVASYQLRTRATIVGNICNASPAGDTIGACQVYGAVLHVHGIDGYRQESLDKFFLGPGKTSLKPGDIVTALQLPLPPKGSAGTYLKLGRNTWSDLSIVGVTAFAYPDSTCASGYRFRLALASIAPVPLLVDSVEDYLASNPINEDTLARAAELAHDACTPIDDVRGSARYRKQMVRNLTKKAFSKVWKMLNS